MSQQVEAAPVVVLADVQLARHRWKRKILAAVSQSVQVAYMADDSEAATEALADRWPHLETAAAAMASTLVDGLVNAGADLVPQQRPADATPLPGGGYLSALFMTRGRHE